MAVQLKVDGASGKSDVVNVKNPDVTSQTNINSTNTKAGATKEVKAVASLIEQEYMTANFEFLPTTKIKARMLIEVVGCDANIDGVYYLKSTSKTYSASNGFTLTASGIKIGEPTSQASSTQKRVEPVKLASGKPAGDSPKVQTITIKRGDTLTKIAKAYGTTVSYLAQLNGIKNVNLIIAGNSIKVPAKG